MTIAYIVSIYSGCSMLQFNHAKTRLISLEKMFEITTLLPEYKA